MWRNWLRKYNQRTRKLRTTFMKKVVFHNLILKSKRVSRKKKRRTRYKLIPLKKMNKNMLSLYVRSLQSTARQSTNKAEVNNLTTPFQVLDHLRYTASMQILSNLPSYKLALVLQFRTCLNKDLTKILKQPFYLVNRCPLPGPILNASRIDKNFSLTQLKKTARKTLTRSFTANLKRFFIYFRSTMGRRAWYTDFKRSDYPNRTPLSNKKLLFSSLGFLYTNKLARQLTKLQLTKFKVKKHTFFDSYSLKKGILKMIRRRRLKNLKIIDNTQRYYYN